MPNGNPGGRFERRHEPLLPRHKFLLRQIRFVFFALLIVFGSLGMGVIGYHYTESLPWLDALLNASMILFGMGPVDAVKTDAGKWFASFYALFSGIAFIGIAGVMVAPVAHRIMHRLHLEQDTGED